MTADRTVKALEVPRLVVVLPDGKEVHHHLAAAEMTIGRDPSNRICLTDHFVSKFHAKLTRSASEEAWILTDLGSANKTFVNDEPVSEATVRFGDAIRFASVSCRLAPPQGKDGPKPASAQPPPPVPAAPAAPPSPSPSPSPASGPAPAPAPAPARAPAPAAPMPARAQPPPPRVSARPGSSAPKIEADPMRRLLKIGGLLILISLVLGIFLRILLVPSETPPSDASRPSGADTPDVGAVAGGATGTETPDTESPASGGEVVSTGAGAERDRAASVDARGNRTAEFYFEEALSYLDTGRLKDAQVSFRKVIDLDPDHARARTRLSLLDEEIEGQAQLHFDNAREAFQFLRYEEAVAEWEMFLQLADPGDVRYAEAQQGIEQAQARLR